MKRKLIIISALLAFRIILFTETVHINISDINADLIRWITVTKTDETRVTDNILDVWLDEKELAYLDKQGVDYQIISRETEWQRSISDYRTYAETYAEITDIASNNSSFVTLSSLGESQGKLYYNEGYGNYDDFQHDIWCLKISDNPQVNEDEPNVFFAAAIHAREPISLEVDMYILHYIVDNYGTDPDITFWVDNTQIWFIPLMNPDGHKLVREYYSYNHRKNIRDNDGDGNADPNNYDGVDLNRNFGYVWGPNGTSSIPSSSLYNGPYAWSEPEVRYVRDLLRSHNFWGGITYHSSGQDVLYPLGNLPGVCAYDHEIMGDLAEEMANTIPEYNSSGIQVGNYTPMQAVDFGYTCQGTMGDWGYSELRMFAFTLELCWTHITTAAWIDQISEDNLEAALIFLDRAHHSTVTGNITDETRSPVVAEIYVQEIDFEPGMTTNVEPVRSDSTFGRYYRPLLPGSYTFTFSLEGYDDITVENVLVNDSTQTILNISFPAPQAPYVAYPLSSISLEEDSSDSSIDLNSVFAIDNGQELIYSYSNNNNISVQITDGQVELTPAANWNGEETILFHATSQDSLTVSEDLQVVVTPLNDPPYVANPLTDLNLMEDTSDNSIDLNNVFADVDMVTREALAFSYTGNDTISVTIESGLVTLVPLADWFGSEEIIFTATDDSLASASDSVMVKVNAVNDSPYIELPDSILIIMNTMFAEDFTQYINDVDGDSLILSSSATENFTTDINEFNVTITPDSNWVGEEIVYFFVDDQVRTINSDSVRVVVYADYLAKPVINSIILEAGSIRIEWEPVPGSTEYVIYSSQNPYSGFEIDESGFFTGNTWVSPFNGIRKFYRVMAKNDH